MRTNMYMHVYGIPLSSPIMHGYTYNVEKCYCNETCEPDIIAAAALVFAMFTNV